MAGIEFALEYSARYPEIQTMTGTKALTKTITVVTIKTASLTVSKTVTMTLTKTVMVGELSASEIKYLKLPSNLALDTNHLIHKVIDDDSVFVRRLS